MANDVTIVVEASVGDALVKLDLAKHAINDLGDEAEQTDAKMAGAAASTGFFEAAMGALNSVMMAQIPLWGGVSAPLIALPAIAVAAAAGVVALASAFGTLVAIVADLVAPVTLVTGLLAGLAGGFVIAAVRAAQGGGPFKDFHKQLEGLHTQFDTVSKDLALRFLPYLERLASGASQALTFIDKLAHEPLAKAMHDMATQGVQMLNQFVNQVSKVVAEPIRLAFQIAFGAGPGGNEFASTVASWWHRFSDFLFGYSEKHVIRLSGRVIEIDQKHVDGIFQPLIDWFNRHHFTKQGIKIGHEILAGVFNSDMKSRLTAFFQQVFADAFTKTAGTIVHNTLHSWNKSFSDWVDHMHQRVNDFFYGPFKAAWSDIKSFAGQALSFITDKLGNVKTAIQDVYHAAQTFWNILQSIADFFSHALTLTINWPSPPGWLSTLAGVITGGGGGGNSRGYRNPTPSVQSASVMSGGIVINVHGADLSDRHQRARVAHQLSGEIMRQWNMKAVGH